MFIKTNKTRLKPTIYAKGLKIYLTSTRILENIGLPLLLLFIRFWMAEIFWYSGLTKISSWQSTLFLFKNEYKVPIIAPEIAAYFSTIIELSCPVLLLLGLGARLATIPMLAMTAVIQFTYLDLSDHRYWAMCLGIILFYGPGVLSLDHLISKKFTSNVR